ncbi:DNA polymerase Y family protein [Oribacterium sp. P6A1]|uniref:DNA polymerase Y family protein n=1 Tax=Oribacterium sp. P6A1 TaxID=1410612 RepID=UPI00068EAAA8|nr:DNA polymerase IV [Oribacterium sp. P6A1]
MNTIFHIDVNSAFLSWTAVKRLKENPDSIDLRKIPSAIGGNTETRHGIITAKSIPAGKFGIKTAMPVIKALELCPELVLAQSDFETYRMYSRAFIDILRKYSPVVEQVSIDEAFLDLTGMEQSIKSVIFQQIVAGTLSERDKTLGPLSQSECMELIRLLEGFISLDEFGLISSIHEVTCNSHEDPCYKYINSDKRETLFHILNSNCAHRVDLFKLLPFPLNAAVLIKDEIRDTLGFTVNVGISLNKLLAKMGSDLEKPDKIHTLYPSEISAKMWSLPIGSLFGCGGKTAAKLEKIGVHTIGDAAKMDPEVLTAVLGQNAGLYIHNSANGHNYSSVSDEIDEAKSISNELTTPHDIDTGNLETDGLKILRQLAEQVSRRLKKHGLYAGTIGFTVKTDDFKRRSIQKKLIDSTNDENKIYDAAMDLMYELLLGTDSNHNSAINTDSPAMSKESSTSSVDELPDMKFDSINRDLSIPASKSGLFGMGYKIRLMCISTANFDHGEYRQMTFDDLIKHSAELEKEKLLSRKLMEKKKKLNDLSESLRRKFGDSIVKKGLLSDK